LHSATFSTATKLEAVLGLLEGVLSVGVLGEKFLLFCLLLTLEEFPEAAVVALV
jgi:hypothetical protein